MSCINITLNIEQEKFTCDLNNKECSFESCQNICLKFEDEDEE